MCNASIGFYRNAKQEGIAEGRAAGRAEGRDERTFEVVLAAMRNGHLTAEKAMDLLSIPVEDRPLLLERLCDNKCT